MWDPPIRALAAGAAGAPLLRRLSGTQLDGRRSFHGPGCLSRSASKVRTRQDFALRALPVCPSRPLVGKLLPFTRVGASMLDPGSRAS